MSVDVKVVVKMNQHKMIIYNFTDLSDLDVLQHVATVIHIGEISMSHNEKIYCPITTFRNGNVVYADKRKNTYTFKICSNEQPEK